MSPGNIIRTIYYMTALLFRAPGMLIKYWLGRRRAVSTFRRELVASGVPHWEAKELSRMYPFKFSDLMALRKDLSIR